jgi:hypothetical protein
LELRVLASTHPLYASDPFCTALQVTEPRNRHIFEVVASWDPWPTVPRSREYLTASFDIRTCQAQQWSLDHGCLFVFCSSRRDLNSTFFLHLLQQPAHELGSSIGLVTSLACIEPGILGFITNPESPRSIDVSNNEG